MKPEFKSPKQIFQNALWALKLAFNCSPVIFLSIYLFQVLASTLPFARSRFFSQLIDSAVYPSSHQSAPWEKSFILFLLAVTITSLFLFLQNHLSRIQDTKFQAFLRTMFIGKVSGLDYQHLEGKDTGNLISKVDEEFGWRTRRTIEDLNGIFANLISLTTVTIILLPRYPVIWVVLFVSQIPQYFIQRYWVQKDWQIHEENSEKNKQMWDLNYKLREKNYISELRINNATSFLYQKFCDIFDYFVKTRTGLRISQTPSEVALIIFSALINGFCLFTLIKGLELNLLTIGLFTFYFETIRQTGDFFRGLVFNSVSITENSYHIGNFRQVINLKNKIISGRQRVTAVSPAKIEFVDVSFHYPNSARYVYRHLNLVISPAEEIAIVGPNGAGKSTLIKLLCRFYDPTAGAILINGINLKNINLDSWYRSLSFLPQEFNTYGDLSLKENVTIARPKSVNHNNVIKALNLADARFYKKYPQGLDTKLSQRYGGEEPSWGQWQKIAIARVFYRNAPVIILDEPTASIDAVSEAKIFNRLYSKTKGKTLIIVSHRFSTVRNAQRILVIDKGKIVEQGSHQDLLAQKGVYAHSYRLQAKGYQEE